MFPVIWWFFQFFFSVVLTYIWNGVGSIINVRWIIGRGGGFRRQTPWKSQNMNCVFWYIIFIITAFFQKFRPLTFWKTFNLLLYLCAFAGLEMCNSVLFCTKQMHAIPRNRILIGNPDSTQLFLQKIILFSLKSFQVFEGFTMTTIH